MKKIIIIIILLSIMIIFTGCNKKTEETVIEETYVPVEVKMPESGNLSKTLTFTGTISSKDTVKVVPSIMGSEEVLDVLVKVGDYVKKDQLLIVLDNENTADQIESTRLQYELAKSSYNSQYESYLLNFDNFKDIEKLYNEGAVSESDYKAAKLRASDNQVKLLRDQLNQAKFAYEKSLENNDDLNIMAPVDGIISSINISENNLVSQNNFISIINLNDLEVKFYIPESKIALVSPQMNVNIKIPSIDTSIPSIIEWINPQKNISKNMYEGNLKLNNKHGLVFPGMKSFVDVELKNAETFLIPIDAVLFDKINYVYIVKDNKSVKTPVEIGDDNGEMIEIISGIDKESIIIVKGQTFVKENSVIKIVRRQ